MKEREELLEYNGQLEKFKFRELTFGEKNRLIEDSTDIKIIGGQQLIKVSVTKIIEGAILKGLIMAPFIINMENIQGMTNELGTKVSEIVHEMNELGERKN
jgi:hypothetical protein